MISRILIVGLGSIGIRHLSIARDIFPEAKIQVLRHMKSEKKSSFDVAEIYSIEEAEEFSPDLVVICNPASFHVSAALSLMKYTSNFLIEKPIANSSADAMKLLKKCEVENKLVMVGYNLRFAKSLQKFRDLITEGLVGSPLSFRCEVGQYLPSWRPERDYKTSVSARREYGGGVLHELSHEIDYLRWIFGDVDWVRATLLKQSDLDIDVEDTAHLTLCFERNSLGGQLIGTLNMDFIRHDKERSCTVIGEKGTLRWNGAMGEISLYEQGDKSWKLLYVDSLSIDETYDMEWRDLIEAIEVKGIPSVSGTDGLRVMEIIEAARISAKTGVETPVVRSEVKATDLK